MNRDEILRTIKEYTDQDTHMQSELNLIDKGLRLEVKVEREKKIRQKWGMDEKREKIKAAKEHFRSARIAASNPMKELLKTTWKAEDNRPGQKAVFSILETMQPGEQLDFAAELDDPVLTTQAIGNVRKLTLEPQDRLFLEKKVQALTASYLDHKTIRELAAAELACVEFEYQAHKDAGGDPVTGLGMGHKADDLRAILATGKLPSHEQITVLTHPDPTERLAAARKAS